MAVFNLNSTSLRFVYSEEDPLVPYGLRVYRKGRYKSLMQRRRFNFHAGHRRLLVEKCSDEFENTSRIMVG